MVIATFLNPDYYLSIKCIVRWAHWHPSVVPVTLEAEAEESVEHRGSKPAWTA
jgi:hypothetical protein